MVAPVSYFERGHEMSVENSKYIRLEKDRAYVVEERVLKAVETDLLIQGLLERASKETPILPAGCVYHAMSESGNLELFVMEKPMGAFRLPFQIRHTPLTAIENEFLPYYVDKMGLEDFKLKPRQMGTHQGYDLHLFMPYTYFGLTRIPSTGAIQSVYAFCVPNERLCSKKEAIYAVQLPNLGNTIGPFCLGNQESSTPTKKPEYVIEFLGRFFQTAFNDDTSFSVVKLVNETLKPEMDIGKWGHLNHREICMLMFHLLSADQKNWKTLQQRTQYEKIGVFETLVETMLQR